jgi:F-type H+-transporting ATPase subunit gamma
METAEAIKRRINSAMDLQSIVRTMKTLAAVSIRQYEQAVESLVIYDLAIRRGMQAVLSASPRRTAIGKSGRGSGSGVIVFGSDQGMCGQFNEQVAADALALLGEMGQGQMTLVVGMRIAGRLEDAGQTLAGVMATPSSVDGIRPLVQRLVITLESWRSEHEIAQVWLLHNSPQGGMGYHPRRLRLLPVDGRWLDDLRKEPWPGRGLPTFTMSGEQLFSALVHQYLFVSLFRACAESLASENAARLMTMQAAEKHIAEHLDTLNTLFHQQRQTAITSELLDIVSGFEALSQPA